MASDEHFELGREVHFKPASRPNREPLRGRRVVLRPVDAASDVEPLYRISHAPDGDPGIWRYLPEGPYESVEGMHDSLAAAQDRDDPLLFTIVDLPSGDPRGVASYLRIVPDHGVIEIGHIWFGPALARTAAATEAVYLLLAHAFDDLGYRRMEWKCNALNRASRRAAERFGFTFEGIFRQHMVVKGRNRDSAWYSITDLEWPGVRRGFERWLSEENFDSGGVQRRALADLIAEGRG